MDKIFSLEEIKIEKESDYSLYSLCCLIIASKFNENDPHIPNLNTYIRICAEISRYQDIFSVDEIRKNEVFILNLLKWKLNFYSIYHFIVFFFAHGIILDNGNLFARKKSLEKIYILSRELLDNLIEDTNNYELVNINNNYIIAAVILTFSIEKLLSITLDNEKENIFKIIYKIDTNSEDYKNTQKKIEEIYKKIFQSKSPKILTTTNRNNSGNKKRITESNKENNLYDKSPKKMTLSPNHRVYIENSNYYQNNINNNNNNSTFIRLHSSIDFKNYHPPMNSDSKLKINDNYLNYRKDINFVPIRKRASSSKNENNNPTYKVNNTTHVEELSNNNFDNLGFASDGIKESSQLIRNEFLSGNTFGRNSNKINSLKTKSVTNFYKKIIPDDILDKTKAIFDKTNKTNNLRQDNYYFINNNLNSNISSISETGNTIIINNNININKYIDKKSINQIYPTYNNHKLYEGYKNYQNKNNNLNNNIGGIQQRYGYFGTYYDYGYEPYKNNYTGTQGSIYYNNNNRFGIQSNNKYGLYGNYGNYY